MPVACIGPITAQTAVAQEFDVVVELDEKSVSIFGLVQAIADYFTQRGENAVDIRAGKQ